MKKLNAYTQSLNDLNCVKETITLMNNRINEIGTIIISSSITLNVHSSELQFIYAIGILNSQILACKELDITTTDREVSKLACKELMFLGKELIEWTNFRNELRSYNHEVYELLDEKERFSLLKYPTKK
jgi:hypothetical protein